MAREKFAVARRRSSPRNHSSKRMHFRSVCSWNSFEWKIQWKGYSDALITKGLLAFLIKGLNDLTPFEVLSVNEKFIEMTGLSKSLTPSRANGFLNIFLKMKAQAKNLSIPNSDNE